MNVYITKLNGLDQRNPLQYRQKMIAEILNQLGCQEMGIYCYNGSNESIESLNGRLDGIIAGIQWGEDIVVCQFPTGNGFNFEYKLVNRLKFYRSRIVMLIHNIESIVYETNQNVVTEMIKLYNEADALIVPSLMMRQFLLDHGIRNDMKFVIQEIWDYKIDARFLRSPQLSREIHYTGSGGFDEMDQWHYELQLSVYADSPIQGQNVHHVGRLSEGELISELSKGGFGLVWNQNEDFKHGMEYGASFELSRYLAAGIPVIVPVGGSNQTLIEKNHLGLVMNSIDETVAVVDAMGESEYQEYVRCIRQFAPSIRYGYYTKKFLIDSIQTLCCKDTARIFMPLEIFDSKECAFTFTVLKESYGGNLALSWSYCGKSDGFLIYDTYGNLIYNTRNVHQHYFLVKKYRKESGFVVKAYLDTLKGKLIVAESLPIYLLENRYTKPKVSLIIPVYNAEEYIVRSIDTALAQSFSELEMIIVDDGSTDHSSEIIDWYSEKYNNVMALHQKNGGVPVARNTGVKHASGNYIGFMDNDDMLYPDMIEKLYIAAERNNCDIAITSIYQITKNGYEKFIQYPMKEDTAIAIDGFFKMHFDTGCMFAVVIWNKLYRSSLIKGRFFPRLIADDDAWTPYILSYANRICYLDDCLYEWDRVIRTRTLVNQWMERSQEDRFIIYKNIIAFYLENGNPERIGLLKQLAKKQLSELARYYGYVEYEKLWKQIERGDF